jgi:hypothetical protein
MKKKKNKEYGFSAKQVVHNYGKIYVVASSIKEAREKLKNVKPDTIDWYTDDYDEQFEYNKTRFELDSIEDVE